MLLIRRKETPRTLKLAKPLNPALRRLVHELPFLRDHHNVRRHRSRKPHGLSPPGTKIHLRCKHVLPAPQQAPVPVALLHQLDEQATSTSMHVFQPRKTIRFRQRASLTSGFSAGPFGSGDNPPNGVVVPYYLKNKPSGEVTLTFSDSAGKVIQSFSSEKEVSAPPPSFFSRGGGDRKVVAEAGANRFVWNMRYPPAEVLPDAVFQGSANGPLAPPGTYSVELTADGQSTNQSFEIVRDPRIGYTDADLGEQFEFLIAVRNKLTETMNVVQKIRELRGNAEEAVQKAGGGDKLDEALQTLNNKLYPLEEVERKE